jgi:DNA-binding XRE family transcriptional regulator
MAKSFDQLAAATMSKRSISRGKRLGRRYIEAIRLADLRKGVGLSQEALAAKLGMKQPTLSKIERQKDMHLSTLRDLVEGMGGKFKMTAIFPSGEKTLYYTGKAPADGRAVRRKSQMAD